MQQDAFFLVVSDLWTPVYMTRSHSFNLRKHLVVCKSFVCTFTTIMFHSRNQS